MDPQPSADATSQVNSVQPAPFRFCTGLVLQEATGLRAATLTQLAKLLRRVPEGCIYHHTHYFLLQHNYLTPEPTNDFAYWVTEVLGEQPLGERLGGIDTMDYATLESLREALAGTVEQYLQANPTARLKFVSAGRELFFVKSVHVIMPTTYTASTLAGFAYALERVSVHSLYLHIFDVRLRIKRPTNDFAIWITEQLGMKDLGERISQLNPYSYTLETLRSMLLALVRQELERQGAAHA